MSLDTSFKIKTQTVLGDKESAQVLSLVESGWTVSEEVMHRTVNGAIVFTVLVRVLVDARRMMHYPADIFPIKLRQVGE